MDQPLLSDEKIKRYIEYKRKYFSHNWESPDQIKVFFIRILGAILVVSVILYFTRSTPSLLNGSECYADQVFKLTDALNAYFELHGTVKKTVLIIASAFLDLALIVFLLEYIVWGKSWRQVIVPILFYTVRACLQAITVLGFPEGYIWENPGFYSVFITYIKSSDFFYSGHVGIMLYCCIDMHDRGNMFISRYCLFCSIFEGIVMILMRCHYISDIIGAVIYTHYLWIASKKLVSYADSFGYSE
jgi:hypothetical protein